MRKSYGQRCFGWRWQRDALLSLLLHTVRDENFKSFEFLGIRSAMHAESDAQNQNTRWLPDDEPTHMETRRISLSRAQPKLSVSALLFLHQT